jgi:integration host factor subunit alpha
MLDTPVSWSVFFSENLRLTWFSPCGTDEEDHKVALTKEKIIDTIYHQVGLSKSQSRTVTENLLELIKGTLEKGENLLISGFGKLVVKEKSARRGRNPQTTEDLQLRARRVVVFKTSGVLRDKINR